MSKTVDQFNPATGEKLEPVAVQDAAAVEKAVKKARVAQKEWAKLSYKERAKHIYKIKRFLADNAQRGAKLISQCNGKTLQDALLTEIITSIGSCDWYAKNTAHVLKPQRLPTGSIMFGNKTNTLTYDPVGVVGIISPWNFPFTIPFGEIIMGLMAGNAIILKVASNVVHVGLFIEECIKAGDLPEGLFTHINIGGAVAGPAFLSAGINKLFFTGSVSVGKQLMVEASKTLTPLSLELGGNDPMLVLEDANIERAVNCACWAGYQNAGQSCGGVERIYVHESRYEEFLNQLIAKTRALRHGPETGKFEVDIGSLTTKGQYDTVKSQVDEAVKMGATIVAQSRPVGDVSKGYFYPATVITGCTPQMRLISEETFGPILPVMSFKTEEEAVALANNIDLALTSSVFSTSNKRARKIAAQLESGVVTINDHLYSHGMAESPWGGWKNSGLGRTHGYLGLKEMTNVKNINEDMIPSWLSPRALYWYPFSERMYNALSRAVDLTAPKSIGDLISSLFTIVKNSSFMFTKWKVSEDKKSK